MASSAAKSELTAGERIAARGRAVTLAALATLTLLAWVWLMSAGAMASASFPAATAMWFVMMIAMMIPAAAPTILLYARVHRHSSPSAPPPTTAFLAGYLICWLGFSVIAAMLQTIFLNAGQLQPMSAMLRNAGVAGAVLVGAGLYQWTPIKDSCLAECRSPAGFLARHFRPGAAGAFRLGLIHGAYCVGCCWLLMAVLFAAGVMNLALVAALTLLVAAEKLLPYGRLLARLCGALLIIAGAALMVR